MRVAMFQNILPEAGRKPGGVSVYVHRLSDALAERGHEVVVFTYSPKPDGAEYSVRPLRLPSARTSRVLRQYVAPWLLNLEDLHDFDVAHFHGEDWFFARRRLPVVRTFHGSALAEARSATSLARRIDKRVVYRLERLAARLATGSYGVGVDSEKAYRARGQLHPGVDLSYPPERRSDAPTILFVGTWSGRKRGSLLFDAFVNRVHPAVPNAELWMVCDECDAAEGVRWIRAPDDEELSRLYSRAWVFCMPSAYEGFGIPYLEAMAHSTPTVATPNPGAATIFGDGRPGLIVSDAELGSTLVELLQSAERRDSLARSGRERAEEFSWVHSARRHEEAYEEAIGRFRAG